MCCAAACQPSRPDAVVGCQSSLRALILLSHHISTLHTCLLHALLNFAHTSPALATAFWSFYFGIDWCGHRWPDPQRAWAVLTWQRTGSKLPDRCCYLTAARMPTVPSLLASLNMELAGHGVPLKMKSPNANLHPTDETTCFPLDCRCNAVQTRRSCHPLCQLSWHLILLDRRTVREVVHNESIWGRERGAGARGLRRPASTGPGPQQPAPAARQARVSYRL